MEIADDTAEDAIVVDSVDSILDVAGEVLSEYGSDPTTTRIERLARWVVCNIDPLIYDMRSGQVSTFEHPAGVRVLQAGERIAVEFPKFVNADEARIAATLLLRAAERADGE